MSYGPDTAEIFHQVGSYPAASSMGAKPGDLPFIQSSKFALVINLQSARALDLDVPPLLLACADEVIE
jgi:putative ABC transport system substrate-binding protein